MDRAGRIFVALRTGNRRSSVELLNRYKPGRGATPAPRTRETDDMNSAIHHHLSTHIRQRLNRLAHAAGANNAAETRRPAAVELGALWQSGSKPGRT
jgi:hypothetical protein